MVVLRLKDSAPCEEELMKEATKAKGLGHLPTATTKRMRARPPQRGTAHLDMYLISTEQRRLEEELAHLEERQRRVWDRVKGNQEELARLLQVAQGEDANERPNRNGAKIMDIPHQPPAGGGQKPWRTMLLEY
jgi:hypothetical protein